MNEDDFIVWENRWGEDVVGRVKDVKEDGELCSTKRTDYCIEPTGDEVGVRARHWGKSDGLRRPDPEDGLVVHYNRNVRSLDCTKKEKKMVCKDDSGESFNLILP